MSGRNAAVFILSLLVGLLVASKIERSRWNKTAEGQIAAPISSNTPAETENLSDEEVEWQEEDDSKLKIKLIETGEGFHGEQIQAESGEIWLGLIKENNSTFLRNAKVTIRLVNDPIVDAPDEKTGKSVYVQSKGNAIFLLKNANKLREGEVETVFDGVSDNDHGLTLKNDFAREFYYRGEKYELRVENKFAHDQFLSKGSKLILEHAGQQQLLIYLRYGCNDCSWSLYWVGDLDRDGKLDFYFDLSTHYNVRDKKLFLSSSADKGKLVKLVAYFGTSGC